MRTFLVPALAALLSLPALAEASSPASAHDDVAYPSAPRAAVTLAQRSAAANPFDDAGTRIPDAGSPAAAPDLFAEHNPYDDAGLGGPGLVSESPALVRVAERAPAQSAGCTCCQS
jgi:hypothetical protein